jgi:hypothetical protein
MMFWKPGKLPSHKIEDLSCDVLPLSPGKLEKYA